eukprot:2351483-Pyramimonas_sp.AAC.1
MSDQISARAPGAGNLSHRAAHLKGPHRPHRVRQLGAQAGSIAGAPGAPSRPSRTAPCSTYPGPHGARTSRGPRATYNPPKTRGGPCGG